MEKDKNLPKKNNFPELEEEDEDSEEEFEISTKFCPYLQARSFFQKFFPKNVTLEYLENFHKNNPQSKNLEVKPKPNSGIDVDKLSDEEIKNYNTGSNLFVLGNIQFQDALEDLTLNFNV